MIEAKLKIGTKIKMVTDECCGFWKVGDIGELVNNSCYHTGELRDRDGQLWASIRGSETNRCCMNDWDFKIIKY